MSHGRERARGPGSEGGGRTDAAWPYITGAATCVVLKTGHVPRTSGSGPRASQGSLVGGVTARTEFDESVV